MKTKHLYFLVCLIAITFTTKAQIKITPGGKATIGYAGTPPTNTRTHFVGNILFSKNSSGNGAMIRGYNGVSSATKPDYTWYADSTTGFFRDNVGNIGIALNGSERVRFGTNGQVLFNNTATPWAPDVSWKNDVSTGIYHPAASTIGFSIAGYEKMRISSNGNLLIGGTSDYGPKTIISGVAGQSAIHIFSPQTADYFSSQVNYVNRDFTKALSVINTASGSSVETFHVYGNGEVWGKNGVWWSDSTLKENVDTINGALNKVLQLKGVIYNFKPGAMGLSSNAKEIGLLAQATERIVPEVVKTDENGLKGIAYQNLVPLLIEAIKEQNKKITQQDAKTQQLQNELINCCNRGTTSPKGTGATRTLSNTITQPETNNPETINWLAQNKPNPFNKETVIEYNVIQEGKGSILIFDMNGKLLKTIPIKIPGKGYVTITANDLVAGMYYYSLVVNDNEIDTKKMILTQ